MASTSTDLVNIALAHIGAEDITDINSTTEKGAIQASRFYTETVKEVSRAHLWNCLIRRDTLRLYGRKPAFEWAYRYNLPSDFLRMERFNGMKPDKPQSFYAIESFHDSLVENDEFNFSTYDSTTTSDLLDDWTVVTGTVKRDTTNDQMHHTGASKIKQTIHCLAKGDHTVTGIIASNTGSGVITYTVEDSDARQLATVSTSAGYTGSTSLNFYSDEKEAVLFVNGATVGAEVKHDSVKVTTTQGSDRVLLTDQDSAQIRYVAHLTDVSQYEDNLVECIALNLASKLAFPMAEDDRLKVTMFELYRRKLAESRRIDANTGKLDTYIGAVTNDSRWHRARSLSTNEQ